MNIAEAGTDEVKVENPLVSGGIYGIVFDYNTINSTYFDTKYEELQSCVDEVKSGKRNLDSGNGSFDMYRGSGVFRVS